MPSPETSKMQSAAAVRAGNVRSESGPTVIRHGVQQRWVGQTRQRVGVRAYPVLGGIAGRAVTFGARSEREEAILSMR